MLGFIVEKMAKHKEEVGSITLDYNTRTCRGIINEFSRIGGRSWMQNEVKVNAKSANA